jgi:hypothetical protein
MVDMTRKVRSGSYATGVAAASVIRTPGLVARHRLWWHGDLVGTLVAAPDGGMYEVFRDTGRRPRPGDPPPQAPAVYVAGFRFRWLGPAGSRRHRLFRRVCVVTVPLFSGCAGYRRKLWLAEVDGARYLGMYEWDDAATASAYDRALQPLLRLLGARGSVHGSVLAGEAVVDHLAAASGTRPRPRSTQGS